MLRVLSRSSFDPVPTILGIKLWLIGSFPLCLVHSRTTKVHRQGTRRGQTRTKRATISRRHWSAWSSRHVSHPVPAWVVWYHQYFKNQLSRRSRATLLYVAIGRSITVSYLPIPSMAAYELLMSRTRLVKDLKFERLRTWMHGAVTKLQCFHVSGCQGKGTTGVYLRPPHFTLPLNFMSS